MVREDGVEELECLIGREPSFGALHAQHRAHPLAAVRSGVGVEEPRDLVNVAHRRRMWVHAGAEATVRLANVVQEGERAEARSADLVERLVPGQARQARRNRGLLQQREQHGGDIGGVVHEAVPARHPPVLGARQLGPEGTGRDHTFRNPSQGRCSRWGWNRVTSVPGETGRTASRMRRPPD